MTVVLEARPYLADGFSGRGPGLVLEGLADSPGRLLAALGDEQARELFQFCRENASLLGSAFHRGLLRFAMGQTEIGGLGDDMAALDRLGIATSSGDGGTLALGPTAGGAGPFFAEMARLSDALARGEIGGREFGYRAGARLMELELEADVLADWERRGPVDPGVGHNGTRILHTHDLHVAGRSAATKAILFYTPPGVANPPHEHHNLISVKRVLKGRYHVRNQAALQPKAGGRTVLAEKACDSTEPLDASSAAVQSLRAEFDFESSYWAAT